MKFYNFHIIEKLRNISQKNSKEFFASEQRTWTLQLLTRLTLMKVHCCSCFFRGMNAGTNSVKTVINSRVARGRLEKATKELITVFRKKGTTKKNKMYYACELEAFRYSNDK